VFIHEMFSLLMKLKVMPKSIAPSELFFENSRIWMKPSSSLPSIWCEPVLMANSWTWGIDIARTGESA